MADANEPSCSGSHLRLRKRSNLSQREVEFLIYNDESEEDIPVDDSDDEYQVSEVESIAESDILSCDDEPDVRPPPQSRKRKRAAADLFTWRDGPFHPIIHDFDSSDSGITFDIKERMSELDFFMEMFSEDVVDRIVVETNRYAAQCVESAENLSEHSVLNKWKDVSRKEMYIFFALTLLMVRTKKLSIKEYWSTNWLIETEAFPALMSRNRYLSILSVIHFANNEEQPEKDRLFKIRDIVGMFRNNFRTKLVPFSNLCIDESLILFKGRLLFKQYIKTKRHRFGIKLYVLCDVQTGYVLDFIIYTGKDSDIVQNEELGVSGSIVFTLLEPYLEKGHTLYTDNWYTSPILADKLHSVQTNHCGTVNKKRLGMPDLSQPVKLARGERTSKCTDKMLVVRWMDKREVRMLSTIHADELKATSKLDRVTKEPVQKPACIADYNVNMGSVDRSDMMLSSVECVRKTVKWYKKVFFHLIDLSLLNAHSLYYLHTKKVSLADFQLKVITQLVEQNASPREHRAGGRRSAEVPLRLVERHFPKPVPSTPKRKDAMRKCHVCMKTKLQTQKRKETRYMCQECGVALCVYPCFEEYHSKKIF